MSTSPDLHQSSTRFGEFSADLEARELRRKGIRIKLQGQPFEILVLLLDRPGRVVTREELRQRLWPSDTFVDFEHGLNAAVNRLREALEDSADEPRFIETIPRRGYRFIAPLEVTRSVEPAVESTKDAPGKSGGRSLVLRLALLFGVIVVVAGLTFFVYRRTHTLPTVAQRSLTRLTFDEGLQIGATWSPDGRYIAYSSDRGGKFDIWVQQVSGGNPVQVTSGPGHHWQPAWSPDGKYIAYRSEEGDGGVYVLPALGGAGLERKIAPFGYYPRWSPDGLQILLQTHFTGASLSSTRVFYVAGLDGSAPREVLAEFLARKKLSAASAAWSPDGKSITVWVGNSSPIPSFWIVPIAGGSGIELEIASVVGSKLTEASTEGEAGEQLGDYTFSWSPSGDAIYFERGYRGARNIWKMAVDPKTLSATGIERLTTGPGPDAGLAISISGKRLAFTAKSLRTRTWLFPFDGRTGRFTGQGNAITSPGRVSVDPALSRDGTKVAYNVPHGETDDHANMRNELWLKSLVDGTDAPVIADGYSRWFPSWSPDGKQLAYLRREPKTNVAQLMVWSSESHDETPLATPNTFSGLYDWSPDGRWLLTCEPDGIWLLPLNSAPRAETAAKRVVASDPAYELYQPHLSPDGEWIVFEVVANSANRESKLYVMRVSGGPWIPITNNKRWNDKPRWSHDGRTVYFVSDLSGFFNVWGIHFDPAAGNVVGQPFQVSKFQNSRLMIPRFISPVGLSLTRDKLALTLSEETGNIWLLDNLDR